MSKPKNPTLDDIREWIVQSDFLDSIPLDEDAVNLVSDAISGSSLIDDLSRHINGHTQEAYDAGTEDGRSDTYLEPDIDELPESVKEEIFTTYAAVHFENCRTLEDFQREYAYLYSQSLTYMK